MSSTIGTLGAQADLTDVLLWSDNEAKKLQGIIKSENDWYQRNIVDFAKDWHRDVFNLNTLNEFGIAVWARILGINLTINLQGQSSAPTFGFKIDQDTQTNQNFDHGNFTSRNGFNVNLTLDQARLLIKLRYLKLISRPCVPFINRMLNVAFGKGQAYIIDPLDMSYVVYVFKTEPGDIVRLMIDYFDLLPRPSCVGVRIVVDRENVFGFGEFNENYYNANFVSEVE